MSLLPESMCGISSSHVLFTSQYSSSFMGLETKVEEPNNKKFLRKKSNLPKVKQLDVMVVCLPLLILFCVLLDIL
jgi:hypothetical protein